MSIGLRLLVRSIGISCAYGTVRQYHNALEEGILVRERLKNLADRLKILFVCSRNQWRSPTAEFLYRDDDRVAVRSRGTARSAVRIVRANDLTWADLVMVMEQKHRSRLMGDFPDLTTHLPIHVLQIPDDYRYLNEELIQLIRSAVDPIIEDSLAQYDREP